MSLIHCRFKKKRNKRKEEKKRVLLSLFCILKKKRQIVFLFTQVYESLNLIYSSHSGFMAMNNMLRALTFVFLKWKNISLFQWIWWKFVKGIINSTSHLYLKFYFCVFGILYVGGIFLKTKFQYFWIHMKHSPYCPAYLALPLSNGMAFPLSNGVAFPLSSGVAFPLSNGVVFPFPLSDGVAFPLHIIFSVSRRVEQSRSENSSHSKFVFVH